MYNGVHSVRNFGHCFSTWLIIIGSQQTNKQNKQDKKKTKEVSNITVESFMIKFIDSPR